MLDSIKRLLPETKSIVFSLFPWRNHAPFVADARNRHPPLNFIKKKILKIVPPREHDCVAKKKCRASYKPRNSCVVDLPVLEGLPNCLPYCVIGSITSEDYNVKNGRNTLAISNLWKSITAGLLSKLDARRDRAVREERDRKSIESRERVC